MVITEMKTLESRRSLQRTFFQSLQKPCDLKAQERSLGLLRPLPEVFCQGFPETKVWPQLY